MSFRRWWRHNSNQPTNIKRAATATSGGDLSDRMQRTITQLTLLLRLLRSCLHQVISDLQ